MDSFKTKDTLRHNGTSVSFYNLTRLGTDINALPFTVRIILENLLRHEDDNLVSRQDIAAVLNRDQSREIPYLPHRVVLQDFTGVPCVVDLAAMRDALTALNHDPGRINPVKRCDLVIDHSVQVDKYGTADACAYNVAKEYERNRERYALLKWARESLKNFNVVPPGTGIVHQVNLEHLARVVVVENGVAFPDTLIGTDSHTTMINGLGVLGWGVGGIEAEAVMLGQPYYMGIPDCIGFRVFGKLRKSVTATDLVLTVTSILRKHGVVDTFVEFFGEDLDGLSIPDRATIANMSPEYGSTCAFFPVDDRTIDYLKFTGRESDVVRLVEVYTKAQNMFRTRNTPAPEFKEILELDLSTVEPCLAGPRRPQDRIPLAQMKNNFRNSSQSSPSEHGAIARLETEAGSNTNPNCHGCKNPVVPDKPDCTITNGSVVIAAITSCTNTSNPQVMIAAGLLARSARARGLKTKPWVKTSLAPGSKVVMDYLNASGLIKDLEYLGFHLTGYGCTTCIGNSGPLTEAVSRCIKTGDLSVAAVLSGNRNFEGRIHPEVKLNYLASPPLVVAYALTGKIDMDYEKEPIGISAAGTPVFLKDIWPDDDEIESMVNRHLTPAMFVKEYSEVFAGDKAWAELEGTRTGIFNWNPLSTYIKRPPFFNDMKMETRPQQDIAKARVLAMFGDTITTDHISPAGSIAKTSPAGEYLIALGVKPEDFNSYGSRRGNDEVMIRGTFANTRLSNLLVTGTRGGFTVFFPTGEQTTIYAAAMHYKSLGIPLIIMAGKEYGSGSSRDWAAKGTSLLGVKAVIAESFERIHRSNLLAMGVLPLQFEPGVSRESLALTGTETYEITGISSLSPRKKLTVKANGKTFNVLCRLDTGIEVDYYVHGGILPKLIRDFAGSMK